MTARNIDLDALRTARAVAEREAPTFTFAGETFVLPVEMPFVVIEAHARADDGNAFYRAALALLGEDQYAHICELGATQDDMGALIVSVPPLYLGGADPEASGASEDSLSTSTRSKPTSNGSTGSTSEQSASESSPSTRDESST